VQLRALQPVGKGPTQAAPILGQPVDGVDNLSLGFLVQGVDPGQELIGDADLPLLHECTKSSTSIVAAGNPASPQVIYEDLSHLGLNESFNPGGPTRLISSDVFSLNFS
jgi:hypothetical protein